MIGISAENDKPIIKIDDEQSFQHYYAVNLH